jgi:hypothetical protein
MVRWYRLGMMALILMLVWGCGSKTSSLEGQVTDGKGKPMGKVKVIAKQVQPIKGYEQFEATTGDDGKFSFKGLFPNSAYEIIPHLENQTTLVRVKVDSAPEGQTRMLPEPVLVRFTRDKDGIINDSATGLQWYLGPNRNAPWDMFNGWAKNLPLGGGGWRVPTVQELGTIVKKGSGPMNIDPIFKIPGEWKWIWSSQLGPFGIMTFDLSSGEVDRNGNAPSGVNRERGIAVRVCR